MQLIALVGLVTIEKIDLTLALAAHFTQMARSVMVLDHISRLALDPARLNGTPYQCLEGRLEDALPPLLESINSDVALLAVSETVPPDDLFVLLDDLKLRNPGLEIETLALIDTRTCDCFPNLRVSLEAYADHAVYLPVEIDAVLEVLNS